MSDKSKFSQFVTAILNAVGFLYLLGAFVAWNLRWVLEVPNYFPEVRIGLAITALFVLFVSCGICGVFDVADKPANETDND